MVYHDLSHFRHTLSFVAYGLIPIPDFACVNACAMSQGEAKVTPVGWGMFSHDVQTQQHERVTHDFHIFLTGASLKTL